MNLPSPVAARPLSGSGISFMSFWMTMSSSSRLSGTAISSGSGSKKIIEKKMINLAKKLRYIKKSKKNFQKEILKLHLKNQTRGQYRAILLPFTEI